MYTIEQLEEISKDQHCNPVWKQLLEAMRENERLRGALEQIRQHQSLAREGNKRLSTTYRIADAALRGRLPILNETLE